MSPYTYWLSVCQSVTQNIHTQDKTKVLGPKTKRHPRYCGSCTKRILLLEVYSLQPNGAHCRHCKQEAPAGSGYPAEGKTSQSANTDQQQLLQLHMTHDPNKMPVRNATCMHNANSMRRTQSTCSAQGTALQTVDNATSAHCRIPQVARVHCTMPQPCTSTLPSACTGCTISHTMPQALHETMPPAAGACTLWDAPQYACHKPGQQIMLISSTPCMHCMLPQAFTSMQCPMQCTAFAARTLHTAEGMF
jgi:hypothetical protein